MQIITFVPLFRYKNPFDFRRLFETPYIPPDSLEEEKAAAESDPDFAESENGDDDESDASFVVLEDEGDCEMSEESEKPKRKRRTTILPEKLPPAKKGKGPAKAKNSLKSPAAPKMRQTSAEQAKRSMVQQIQEFLGSMISNTDEPKPSTSAKRGSKAGSVAGSRASQQSSFKSCSSSNTKKNDDPKPVRSTSISGDPNPFSSKFFSPWPKLGIY